MKTYQIHLIRHGIIDGNLKGQYIGSTDCSLCETGIERLKKLRERFVYPSAAAYLISPMKRCRETLEILYPGVNALEIDAFRECCFGDFEGLSAAELRKNKDFSEWIAGGGVDAPPGGESGEHFAARVCEGFEMVVNGLIKTGTTGTVIVAHAGTIMTILARYGLPRASMSDWIMDAGCGYSVRIHPQLWSSGRVMEVYSMLPAEICSDDSEEGSLLNAGREAAARAAESAEADREDADDGFID